MAITTAICTSFKKELLEGTHNLDHRGYHFKVAFYTSSANYRRQHDGVQQQAMR